ncbi:hypothetical protein JNB63_03940 [Microbacterium trichothecenolyticum]|uniref:hypothetical protein n=1 Tax=Microbacterium trichothecenolyticum TaxID=69370 RepID=UPI001C6F5B19|nr:hypothetical protein [Microbacterium trichothecenolyticum]MBW9119236.1 hypothetical protein [Microbacterium trichothecenolyticum]
MVIAREPRAPTPARHDAVEPQRVGVSSGRIPGRDLLSDGVRISVELAPLIVPERATVVRAVRALIGMGADARAGRTFEGVRWRYDGSRLDEQAERMVQPLPLERTGDAGLPRLREIVAPDLPFMVFLGEDRASLCIDHRLGDGFLGVMLTAGALAGRGTPAVFASADDRDPLPAALSATYGRHASRLGALLRDRWADARPGYSGPTVPAAGGRLDLVTGTMDAATFRDLADWSRGRVPPTLAMMFALHEALRRTGVPVMDEGAILVDLRRYLPSGRSTLANFVVGHPVSVRQGIDVAGSRFHRDLHVGRPLAALTSGLATQAWRRRAPTTVPAAASPTLSDMGFLRALEPLPWASDDAVVRVSVDPAGRNGITALTAVLRRRLNISLSFDSSLWERDAVTAACDLLRHDPKGLLP